MSIYIIQEKIIVQILIFIVFGRDGAPSLVKVIGPPPLKSGLLSFVTTLYRPDFQSMEVTQLSKISCPSKVLEQVQDNHKSHILRCFPVIEVTGGYKIRPLYLSRNYLSQACGNENSLDRYSEFNLVHALDIKRKNFQGTLKDVLCFAIYTPDTPGRLDAEKAVSLGVPYGPLLGKLKRGHSVMTPDGNTINPEDCMGTTTSGGVTLLIDCPSEEFLEELVMHPCLNGYIDSEKKVISIVHISPVNMVLHPDYISFFQKFGKNIMHMFLCAEVHNVPLMYYSSSVLQHTIRGVLGDQIMPNLHETCESNISGLTTNATTITKTLSAAFGKQIQFADAGSKMVFHPATKTKLISTDQTAFFVSQIYFQYNSLIILILNYYRINSRNCKLPMLLFQLLMNLQLHF